MGNDAIIAVNSEMLQFYWELGAEIVEKQKSSSWGDRLLPQLSRDLSAEFPEMKGFSVSNLKYMRQWLYRSPKLPRLCSVKLSHSCNMSYV